MLARSLWKHHMKQAWVPVSDVGGRNAMRLFPWDGVLIGVIRFNALGLYRECGGVARPGKKRKPIADAFPIQAIELSR
jgi:hypothetical protein